MDLLSPYEFARLQGDIDPKYKDTYYKEGEETEGVPYKYQTLDDYIGVAGVDWQGETFNPTWSQDHNVTIMGGTDNTKYNGSLSRYVENGIFKIAASTEPLPSSVWIRKSTRKFLST